LTFSLTQIFSNNQCNCGTFEVQMLEVNLISTKGYSSLDCQYGNTGYGVCKL
jgi:hypothetical protein